MDLKAPGAVNKSADFRFVRRVLCPDEQRMLAFSENPDRLLWAFWAAKEAAYKAASKLYPGITSAPRRYPADLDFSDKAAANGHVYTPVGPVGVKIHFSEDHVHCIGIIKGPRDPDDVIWGVGEIPPGDGMEGSPAERESRLTRKLAEVRIARILGCRPDEISIIRQQGPRHLGPPTVRFRNRPQKIDISLSQDGRFAAYAISI